LPRSSLLIMSMYVYQDRHTNSSYNLIFAKSTDGFDTER